MIPVITAEESKRCDAVLMQQYGHNGYALMCSAGEGIANAVKKRFPDGCRTLICCGPGNNGGDGFVVARLLKQAGFETLTAVLCPAEKIGGDALIAYGDAQDSRCPMTDRLPCADEFDCIVDALFGTGLKRDLPSDYANIIAVLNRSTAYKISVDIPFGINGTTGAVCGAAFKADETVTVQYRKTGLVLTPGREYAGKITVCEIAPEYPINNSAYLMDEAYVKSLIPERPMDSHKGKNGHALLVGGSSRYTGAVLMSAKAALRGGAGITSVAVPAAVRDALYTVPEAISVPCGDSGSWDSSAAASFENLDLSRYTAFAIGPGLDGMPDCGPLKQILLTKKPTVIDADALNCLSRERDLLSLLHERVLLTPHPGEMARLTQKTVDEVISNPVKTAVETSRTWHCSVILKGATSVITDGDRVHFNISGNPGLAKGGSGDVLTGISLAMLSQGLPPFEAGCAASFLLGASADKALQILSTRALIATDVIDLL